MKKVIAISVPPEHCGHESDLLKYISGNIGEGKVSAINILRKSLDARRRPIVYHHELEVFFDEAPAAPEFNFEFKSVANAPHTVIIGSGPAGLFAALKLIERGIKPLVFERGKDVKERRRDLADIMRLSKVNPESNYCFGEGGAGTYSDGKLYTRSTKRGDVRRILNLFVAHGADPSILYEAHPHIGTNKLPGIITRIRETILHYGGEIHFNSKLTDIHIEGGRVAGVEISKSGGAGATRVATRNLILATGHSARDVFELLQQRNILIEAKPFALGVRIEHPQQLIDSIQYKLRIDNEVHESRGPYLPPASYSLVNQSLGHGVFSFCMCPGGIIAPAATAPGEIVVNGWSPSKRNNEFANSGLVVTVGENDFRPFKHLGALAAMKFQESVEQKAFAVTGTLKAPAQRVMDFVNGVHSQSLPFCSYIPGLISSDLSEVLPAFITDSLRDSIKTFGKKMKGYLTNEGVIVATESRTSSPVRIPRDKETLQHPQVGGLYPCAEGAGYAGGIISAAIDGERCAEMIRIRSGTDA